MAQRAVERRLPDSSGGGSGGGGGGGGPPGQRRSSQDGRLGVRCTAVYPPTVSPAHRARFQLMRCELGRVSGAAVEGDVG